MLLTFRIFDCLMPAFSSRSTVFTGIWRASTRQFAFQTSENVRIVWTETFGDGQNLNSSILPWHLPGDSAIGRTVWTETFGDSLRPEFDLIDFAVTLQQQRRLKSPLSIETEVCQQSQEEAKKPAVHRNRGVSATSEEAIRPAVRRNWGVSALSEKAIRPAVRRNRGVSALSEKAIRPAVRRYRGVSALSGFSAQNRVRRQSLSVKWNGLKTPEKWVSSSGHNGPGKFKLQSILSTFVQPLMSLSLFRETVGRNCQRPGKDFHLSECREKVKLDVHSCRKSGPSCSQEIR